MLLDFFATVVAGAGLAGIVMGVRMLTRGAIPKWTVPASLGLGMLMFAIWNEYTWFDRVSAQLPPEAVVVSAPMDRVFYRPWTYVAPMVTRFIALDRTDMLISEAAPTLRVASAVVVQRWMPTQRVPMAFDCAGNRRADLFEGASLGENGTLQGAEWYEVGADDTLVKAACTGG